MNEIDLQGNVIYAHKTDLKQKKDETTSEKKKDTKKFCLTEENKDSLKDILSNQDFENIEKYLQELEAFLFLILRFFKKNRGDKNKSLEIVIPSPEDKDERRKIHETIRNNLKLFESETVIFPKNC